MANVCMMLLPGGNPQVSIVYATLSGIDKWTCDEEISFLEIRSEKIDVALDHREVCRTMLLRKAIFSDIKICLLAFLLKI